MSPATAIGQPSRSPRPARSTATATASRFTFPTKSARPAVPSARAPAYQRQKDLGAIFGLSYGWEHPLWFAGNGTDQVDEYGFERQSWFQPIKAECLALRNGVGIVDTSNFAKYEVKGPGAADWLDRVVANRVPTVIGRSCLAPLLSHKGGIAGDFTITKVGDDHFMMIGSGIAERYHKRFFDFVPRPEGVTFTSRTDTMAGFNVAGPKSRALLERLTNADLSNDAFPFFRSQQLTVAGIDALALRVSFTGDLGWEFYVEEDRQLELYDALIEAGRDLDVRPVGSRSLLSLRVEKGYGSWSREYSPEYWPHEVGLDPLVKGDKPDFIGRDAYLKLIETPPREKLVMLEIDVETADASGGEPVFTTDGRAAGRITSGTYGHFVDKSLGLAMIRSDLLEDADTFDVAVLGRPHRARLLPEAPFDPKGARLRG